MLVKHVQDYSKGKGLAEEHDGVLSPCIILEFTQLRWARTPGLDVRLATCVVRTLEKPQAVLD